MDAYNNINNYKFFRKTLIDRAVNGYDSATRTTEVIDELLYSAEKYDYLVIDSVGYYSVFDQDSESYTEYRLSFCATKCKIGPVNSEERQYTMTELRDEGALYFKQEGVSVTGEDSVICNALANCDVNQISEDDMIPLSPLIILKGQDSFDHECSFGDYEVIFVSHILLKRIKKDEEYWEDFLQELQSKVELLSKKFKMLDKECYLLSKKTCVGQKVIVNGEAGRVTDFRSGNIEVQFENHDTKLLALEFCIEKNIVEFPDSNFIEKYTEWLNKESEKKKVKDNGTELLRIKKLIKNNRHYKLHITWDYKYGRSLEKILEQRFNIIL